MPEATGVTCERIASQPNATSQGPGSSRASRRGSTGVQKKARCDDQKLVKRYHIDEGMKEVNIASEHRTVDQAEKRCLLFIFCSLEALCQRRIASLRASNHERSQLRSHVASSLDLDTFLFFDMPPRFSQTHCYSIHVCCFPVFFCSQMLKISGHDLAAFPAPDLRARLDFWYVLKVATALKASDNCETIL